MDNNLDQAKGKVKRAVGGLTGNKDLENKGRADETAGKIKEHLEDAEVKTENLVDKVKNKVTKN